MRMIPLVVALLMMQGEIYRSGQVISKVVSLSVTCNQGELSVVPTDSPSLYICTAPNTWTVVSTGAGGGADTALSNLASVAINTALIPGSAAGSDFGSATKPWKDLYFAGTSGTPGTNNFKITGASTSGTRILTLADGAMTLLTGTEAVTANTLAVFAATTSAQLFGVISDETGGSGVLVGSTGPTFTSATAVNFGATGVSFTDDGDGAITLKSLSAGSAEDLTLNLDDTANTGVFTSSTGLNLLNFSAIALRTTGTVSVTATADRVDIGLISGEPFIILEDSGTAVISLTNSGGVFSIKGGATTHWSNSAGTIFQYGTTLNWVNSSLAGIIITQDNDGGITYLGAGNGNDEDLKWNFDDGAGGANTVEVTSSTGANRIDFTSIKLNPASYAVAGTDGADCTSAANVTTVKGLVTACSVPLMPVDEMARAIFALQAEVASLRAELAALKR